MEVTHHATHAMCTHTQRVRHCLLGDYSTAAFGNWGILQGASWLRNHRPDENYCIKARLFMGGKGTASGMVKVKASDSEERITQQWDALRAAFLRDDTGASPFEPAVAQPHVCMCVFVSLRAVLHCSPHLPPKEPLRAAVCDARVGWRRWDGRAASAEHTPRAAPVDVDRL